MATIKNIILDLDGTIWDSRQQVLKAWQIALKNKVNIKLNIQDLNNLMGKTNDEYIKVLFKDFNDETAKNLMELCEKEEVKYLKSNGAKLFDNALNVIYYLNKYYNLYIVSNCQNGYIESFLNYYKLSSYFKDFECNGNTGLCKSYNIKKILNRNNLNPENTCYVGDTTNDFEAAKDNNLLFIWASYGFGQINKYNLLIKNLTDLPILLKELNNKI